MKNIHENIFVLSGLVLTMFIVVAPIPKRWLVRYNLTPIIQGKDLAHVSGIGYMDYRLGLLQHLE